METKETIIYERQSKSRIDGTETTLQIIALPSGGRYWYPEYIRKQDKIIFIRLIQNGLTIDYPFTENEPFLMWAAMVDVWVKPEKKKYYIDKFLGFIQNKRKESGF